MKATAALLVCIGVCAAIIAATLFTPAGPPPAQPVVTALLTPVIREVPLVSVPAPLAASLGRHHLRGSIAFPMMGGDANYADPVHGSKYLAIRFPRGTLTRICGDGRCLILRSTDYGPKRSTGDIADIGLASFAPICGYTIAQARIRGECQVSIELIGELPQPPATDTE